MAPTKIYVPLLLRFGIRIKDGTKTMTCRTYRIGYPGDVAGTPFGNILIEDVTEVELGWVADNCWMHEGVASRQEFIDIWRRLHPIRGFVPTQKVFLHRFKYIGDSNG